MSTTTTFLSPFLAVGALALPFAAVATEPPSSEPIASDPVTSGPMTAVAPLVIAHRGASGYRPEHTIAAYEYAIELGADYIEADVVSTRDGVLVARHENEISGTTDVAERPEFADRQATKTIEGTEITGWFTEDFTFDELRTLRASERLAEERSDNTVYDGMYEVPTLEEAIALAAEHGVGIYIETKHPSYFDSIALSLEEPLVELLDAAGLTGEDAAVFLQSFENSNLQELDAMTDVPLVQLVNCDGAPYDFVEAGEGRTYDDMLTADGLAELATYVDGLGPCKDRIIPRDDAGNLLEPTTLVADAHAAGMVVHPWTFRNENVFLPADFRGGNPEHPGFDAATGDAAAEYQAFFEQGIDGLFSDYPDTAIAARDTFLNG